MKKIGFAAFLLVVALFGGVYWFNGQEETPKATVLNELRNYDLATFAGGCFWCVEAGFEKVPGVKSAISGFSGGDETNPTYYDVARGKTGHTESVQVYYDSSVITYDGLLAAFWRMMDPTDGGGQFNDRGMQYRPAIFYHNEEQKILATKSLSELEKTGRFAEPLEVEIKPFKTFYKAEETHQDYYRKNPVRYALYTNGSGRAGFVEETWKEDLKLDYSKYRPGANRFTKPSNEEIKRRLTALQYEITQNDGTEPPFKNEYWDNKRDGIYVDVVSGEPLFSSKDKFKSGTGWPSFTQPIRGANIVEKTDTTFFMKRVELRSAVADSHLGHVFDDGPAPTGKRYCINSAALRFIPADKLVLEGYSEYEHLFAMKGL